jgi:hypothetical protein
LELAAAKRILWALVARSAATGGGCRDVSRKKKPRRQDIGASSWDRLSELSFVNVNCEELAKPKWRLSPPLPPVVNEKSRKGGVRLSGN